MKRARSKGYPDGRRKSDVNELDVRIGINDYAKSNNSRKMWVIVSATVASLRLVVRIIFTIMTESLLVIPMICCPVVCVPLLAYLWKRYSCEAICLFTTIEAIFATMYYVILILAIDTTDICNNLDSDTFCETLDVMAQLKDEDYVRRPHAWLATLVVPGLIFDCIFIYVFR